MLVRGAAIIAPFTCDWQRRPPISSGADLCTRVLGASSGVPGPAAGPGRTEPRCAPYTRPLSGARKSFHENRPRAAYLPGADLCAAALMVLAGMRNHAALTHEAAR